MDARGSGSRQSAKTRHPRIEAWKQRLLDTSLRNRLLKFRDTKQSLDLVCAELVKITARTLGFSRTGDKVASHVQLGVSAVLELGRARLEGDKIVLA